MKKSTSIKKNSNKRLTKSIKVSPLFTEKDAKKLGKYFHINFKVVPFKEWQHGFNVELEHGSKFGSLTNISNDNPKVTAKIAIAHLKEDPRYYYYLNKMESAREKYWNKKGITSKPSIFLHPK